MKKKGYHYVVESPQYQNCQVLNQDGQLMFRCSSKKAKWYLDRNLATQVNDNPLTVQLNFIPKGNGHIGDPYHLQQMENKCVVCGESENLTRHHVVPYCYRRYFPDIIKNHRAYDVMAMCTDCHHVYEFKATQLKREIGNEYGMPVNGNGVKVDKNVVSAKTAAHAILNHAPKMPSTRLEELYGRIRNYLGRDATQEDLEKLIHKEHQDFKDYVHHGKYVVGKIPISQIEEFIKRWRKHFIITMQPKFLPKYWSIERSA